jgi:Mg/Co/Ni transporter MgtE
MIKILSKAKSGEGYIIDPKGILIGKILLPELLCINNKKIPPEEKLYKKFLSLDDKSNVFESIEKIKDFVGESVPVTGIDERMLGVITESDLFNQLLSAENVRKKEELSD